MKRRKSRNKCATAEPKRSRSGVMSWDCYIRVPNSWTQFWVSEIGSTIAQICRYSILYGDTRMESRESREQSKWRSLDLCICVCLCVSRGAELVRTVVVMGAKCIHEIRAAGEHLWRTSSDFHAVLFFFFFWLRRFPGRSRGWSYVHIVRCLKRRSCGTRDGLCAQQSPVRPGAGQPSGESWNPFSISPQYLRKSSSVRLCLFRGKNLAEICDIPELFKFYNQEIEPNTEIVVILICYIGNWKIRQFCTKKFIIFVFKVIYYIFNPYDFIYWEV